MELQINNYREKLLGCWMGKNIGGTLGAPFEWRRQVNDVSFYTMELHGDPLPNDDLDIQLLWLIALEECGVEVDAKRLAEYWLLYVTPHWAEYGTAKINLKSGLMPPLSGSFNNVYKNSCGAFIRSEIWACIAPGCPSQAARFAFEDAVIDHGNGEGVYGEVFCAALESAAFVEPDIHRLIDIGLSYIPADCGVAKAVRCARECHASGQSWQAAREEMLTKYRGLPFPGCICEEDIQKGYNSGLKGWDVPSNIGMLIIGLLYGEGDFDRSVCITVNCGEDTDCTAATFGSIFGIINGIDAIPEKWKQPIGKKIKTACLNLGELGYFGNQLPADIEELTDRVGKIAQQVQLKYNIIIGKPGVGLFAGDNFGRIYDYMRGPVYHFDFFDVLVDYCNSPCITDNVGRKVRLRVENKYKIQEMINVRVLSPANLNVSPSSGKVFILPSSLGENMREIELYIIAEKVEGIVHRFYVEFTLEGRHTIMAVPVVLVSGNMMPAEQ